MSTPFVITAVVFIVAPTRYILKTTYFIVFYYNSVKNIRNNLSNSLNTLALFRCVIFQKYFHYYLCFYYYYYELIVHTPNIHII